MENWVNWYEQPYAEDDALLNKFVEDTLQRVSWKLFEDQDHVVHMAYETEEGIPKMREDAIAYVYATCRNELDWLISYMVDRILVAYLKSNILPSEEIKWRFENDLPEEDIAQFWAEIDDYIWNDYVEHLGEAETAKLWERWGKMPRKEN